MPLDSLKPYLYQFTGRVAPQLIGIVISSVIVRHAGINTYGHYSLLVALVSISFGIVGLALDTDYQRTCEASRAGNVLSAKLVSWLAVFVIIVALSSLGPFEFDTASLALLAVGIFFQQCIETRVVRDRILNRDAQSLFPRLAPVCVYVILLFAFRPDDLHGIVLLFAFAWATSVVFLFDLFRSLRFNLFRVLRSIKHVLPIWMSLLMTQAYGNVDLYVIRLFHPNTVVGIFKLAYTFASMAMPIAGVLSFIFLSKISTAAKKNDSAIFRQLHRRQFMVNLGLGLSLLLFMRAFFPYVSRYLYGAPGLEAVAPARLLAGAMLLNMLCMVYSYSLLAIRKEKTIAVVTTVGGVCYLGLAFLLIPPYAANGAAVAMLLTYLLIVVAYFFLYKKNSRLLSLGVAHCK